MTFTATHESLQILAHPLGEGSWRVCAGGNYDSDGATVGYIEELGGTYEVRVLEAPTNASFVETFKQAMECFSTRERVS